MTSIQFVSHWFDWTEESVLLPLPGTRNVAKAAAYSKTSVTAHLHRSTTPLYRSVYLELKQSPIQYHCTDILILQTDHLGKCTF